MKCVCTNIVLAVISLLLMAVSIHADSAAMKLAITLMQLGILVIVAVCFYKLVKEMRRDD